jgi:hypothetical protein
MGAQKSTRGLRLRQPHDSIKVAVELVSRAVGYESVCLSLFAASSVVDLKADQSTAKTPKTWNAPVAPFATERVNSAGLESIR